MLRPVLIAATILAVAAGFWLDRSGERATPAGVACSLDIDHDHDEDDTCSDGD